MRAHATMKGMELKQGIAANVWSTTKFAGLKWCLVILNIASKLYTHCMFAFSLLKYS